MAIALEIQNSIKNSSMIRKMFEEGARLKAQFGAENVYDFSLGNPDLEPPKAFFSVVQKLISNPVPRSHGYMPNAGFPQVREAIASKVSKEQGVEVKADGIIMTCGAAGGMNIALKTLLNPGDEIILIKPFFAEYIFYVKNYNAVAVPVDTNKDFSINVENIRKAITPKTKAIIINSPNNPTGKIYAKSEIQELADALRKANTAERTIYIISDEPYREIVFDGREVPSLLALYENTIYITSYSKSLSLPGERIGYVAVQPSCADFSLLMDGMILCNRILGFVNAPALMQRVVAELLTETVNIDIYRKKRDLLVEGLSSAGYEFIKPEGAFYFFCKAPVDDEIAFVNHLQKYNILVVPGTGFFGPGYFRMAFCVEESTIKNSIPKFKEALQSFGK
jgi:aspartate aminotransferase